MNDELEKLRAENERLKKITLTVFDAIVAAEENRMTFEELRSAIWGAFSIDAPERKPT